MILAVVAALPTLIVLAGLMRIRAAPLVRIEAAGDMLHVRLGNWDRLYCVNVASTFGGTASRALRPYPLTRCPDRVFDSRVPPGPASFEREAVGLVRHALSGTSDKAPGTS